MTEFKFATVETQIIRSVIETLLSSGYSLGVYDGGEHVVGRCREAATILKAMRSTGEDYLMVYDGDVNDTGPRLGWVRFIYGNLDYEVINDYTTNLEDVLAPINAEIDRLFS